MKTLLRSVAADAIHMTGLGAMFRRRCRAALTIPCYHRVLPGDLRRRSAFPDLALTPEAFAAHVRFCRRHYDCLTLAEAMGRFETRRQTARPILCLTFDDGYWDNFEYARDILNEHGLHATFFVISGLVGAESSPWYDRLAAAITHLRQASTPDARTLDGDDPAGAFLAERLTSGNPLSAAEVVRSVKCLPSDEREAVVDRACAAASAAGWKDDGGDRLMTSEQLRQLADDGHEVASHTQSHPILTQLAPDRLAQELVGSRSELEALLGRPVVSLAYPNGDHDEAVVFAARQAGYHYAVATLPGVNPIGTDPLRLRRVHLSQERTSRPSGECSTNLLELELAAVADSLFLRRRTMT